MKRRSFLKSLGIAGALAPLTLVWLPTKAGSGEVYRTFTGEGTAEDPIRLTAVRITYNPDGLLPFGDTAGVYEARWEIGEVRYGIGCIDRDKLLRGLPMYVEGSIRGYKNYGRLIYAA